MKQSRFGAWVLFGLLTVAGILNLVDRQIISVLKPEISQELNWTADDYGTLGAWFQGAMAVGLLISGPLVDRIGVRWANALGVFAWSVSAVFHGFARTLGQFTICRVALGATESMGTPTMIKTVATILPANLRSAGFGIINAVNSLGAVAAPILIPLIAIPFGWRGTFVAAGLAGVVWTGLWLLVTRKGLPVAEQAPEPVEAAPSGPAPSILKDRATWAIAGAKVLSDATWWLMLFWMPDFLNRQFGLSGVSIGPPIALAYAGAAAGALISGTVATRLLARGVSVDRARKGAMLVSGLMVLVLPLALFAKTPWEAAAVLAIVLAAHQGFSTNLFALIADVTDPAKIGRVTSVGAFCGNIGGMLIVKAAGMILTAGLGYSPLFLFAGASYLLALGWIQLWLPRIESRGGQAPVQVGH
ncbi:MULTISPECIES: MFS transporter [Phenylobacterium]|jgi:ACS family hexuronate transporter-like MFS transporter|uniref:MFS transporter n=1 Tax=Phenylobacterium conjunctum TaxID=1298959 RepID=A0ABW3SWU8_9CAUL